MVDNIDKILSYSEGIAHILNAMEAYPYSNAEIAQKLIEIKNLNRFIASLAEGLKNTT